MKNIFLPIMTILSLFGLIVSSCISDAISSSPSDTLTFSRDTVNFDTVFTDLGTPTARLIVSNRAKKGVNISSIRLRNPNSNFSINVDGVSARDFSNVEIPARDSIYVFIECYIPSTSDMEPARVEDELEFVTNGVTQSVLLEAYGQNVARLKAVVIDSDTRLTSDRPYVVFDSLVVAKDAVLSIDPGVKMLFHDDAVMKVYGRLEAIGDPQNIIEMRGDRMDNVLPDVSYDIMAGQWQGIVFAPSSVENRMEYVDMRSTVFGVVAQSDPDVEPDYSRSKILLRNSWLHNSQSTVLASDFCRIDAYGVCFSEAAEAVVWLQGGEHRFIQCTFANNYLFSAITMPIISLFHLMPNQLYDDPRPLMEASFENSIIYGIAADINEGNLDETEVFLRNVSLKSAGTDDDHFIDCLWETDPMFLTIRPKYYFNYHVAEDSPVIGKGNPAFISPESLYDIDGYDRLSSGAPTLGAYAHPEMVTDTDK